MTIKGTVTRLAFEFLEKNSSFYILDEDFSGYSRNELAGAYEDKFRKLFTLNGDSFCCLGGDEMPQLSRFLFALIDFQKLGIMCADLFCDMRDLREMSDQEFMNMKVGANQ